MPGPKAVPITLSEAERQGLEQLVKRHATAQQIAQRGRMVQSTTFVLLAADGSTNAAIARDVHMEVDSVRLSLEGTLASTLVEFASHSVGRPQQRRTLGRLTALGCARTHQRGSGLSEHGDGL